MVVEDLDSWDIVISKVETHITNIEITWHDLWRQDDIQLARAAMECLICQVPCPVCGKVMRYRTRSEGVGMGYSISSELRCRECSLSIDLPDNLDIIGTPKALYDDLYHRLGRVAKPTGLRYPLCVTISDFGTTSSIDFRIKDPDTGDVLKPEEYKGRYLWEDGE